MAGIEGLVIVALIVGVVAFLAYSARSKVGTFTDQEKNPKRPAPGGRGPRGIWGGPGGDLVDPGPTDGGTRPIE